MITMSSALCGYLMTEHKTHPGRTSAEYVDKDTETVPGEVANTNGAAFFHTEATCNGLCVHQVKLTE